MKATGIIRRVDELGRIVIPKEIRSVYNINTKDPLEIFTDNSRIVLKKYEISCILCEEKSNLIDVDGKKMCSGCIDKIKMLIE